jgi:hypothetical protein
MDGISRGTKFFKENVEIVNQKKDEEPCFTLFVDDP